MFSKTTTTTNQLKHGVWVNSVSNVLHFQSPNSDPTKLTNFFHRLQPPIPTTFFGWDQHFPIPVNCQQVPLLHVVKEVNKMGTFFLGGVGKFPSSIIYVGGNLSACSVGGTSATEKPSKLHSTLHINPYKRTFPNCDISCIMKIKRTISENDFDK